MCPLIPNGIIGTGWDFVIALILGVAFGFILEASGFSSSRNIVGVFLWLQLCGSACVLHGADRRDGWLVVLQLFWLAGPV